MTAGTLPAGLTLNTATGAISGTPTKASPILDGFTNLASFGSSTNGPNTKMVEDGNGDLFGTTTNGGTSGDGTLFEIPAGTDTLTTVASFTSAMGSPSGSLAIDSHGDIFGPTNLGVFELGKGSTTLTTVASVYGTPYGNVVLDGNGDVFGITRSGGAGGGSIYEIVSGSNTAITLASLEQFSSNDYPNAGLVMDSNGDLFGTTVSTPFFELANGSNTLTYLANVGADGPVLIDANGNIYTTTSSGGSSNDGAIMEIAAGTYAVTTFASFNGSNGASPVGGLVEDSRGDFYGVTYSGRRGQRRHNIRNPCRNQRHNNPGDAYWRNQRSGPREPSAPG